MDIDLAVLRGVERERDISLDVLIPAIEQALLLAYHRSDGSYRNARAELDRLGAARRTLEAGRFAPASSGA